MAMVWAGRQQSTVGNVTIARNGLCYAARPWEGELRGDPAGAHWDIVTKSPRQRDAPPLSSQMTLTPSNIQMSPHPAQILKYFSWSLHWLGPWGHVGRLGDMKIQ